MWKRWGCLSVIEFTGLNAKYGYLKCKQCSVANALMYFADKAVVIVLSVCV